MAREKSTIVILVVVLVLLGIGAYFVLQYVKAKPALGISGYYDEDGNLLSMGGLAVVGGIEGVKYITLEVNAQNKDEVPLTFEIMSAGPTAFQSVLDYQSSQEVEPGDYATWVSGLIDIEPYVGGSQTFSVSIRATSPYRKETQKTSTLTVEVFEDPESLFEVTVTSDAQDPGMSPSCVESWQCTEWSDCLSGRETRTCTDANNCGTTLSKPVEQRDCIVETDTVLFRTESTLFGSKWVMYAGVGYGYYSGVISSTIASDCRDNPFPGILDLSPIRNGYWIASVDDSELVICISSGKETKVFKTSDNDAIAALTNPTPIVGYETREIYYT